DSIDMPLHHMPAEPVADPQCPFEIDPATGLACAKGGPIERCHDHMNVEGSRAGSGHRETRAVHRDALTQFDIGPRRFDLELAPAVCFRGFPDRSDGSHDAGEHQAASYIVTRSSLPAMSILVRRQRCALAIGTGTVRVHAGTPPPSQIGA